MPGVMIDSGDTFILTNLSETETLEVTLRGRTYKIEPGQNGFVPFELIRVWWGDPRSREDVFGKFSDSLEKGYINKREDEIKRLGVLYGSYAGDVVSLNDPEWPAMDPRRGSPKRVPHPVRIRTERGEDIIPAGLDVTNKKVYAAVRRDSEDLSDEVQYRQHLEEQMDEMRAELARLGATRAESDVEVDGAPSGVR